jgi:hypothetical protein
LQIPLLYASCLLLPAVMKLTPRSYLRLPVQRHTTAGPPSRASIPGLFNDSEIIISGSLRSLPHQLNLFLNEIIFGN